ncbi:MAG: 30S ribosomal protein S14 [Planctomycetes bacterium]|jgi:small subunit ribosomal protein S14|nr:30S ribosomal protein S14 [Planctomycetota bacterium]
MAKTSSVHKNLRRRRTVERFRVKRTKLMAIIRDDKLPMEERDAARRKLMKLPRDSSATRIRNRCNLTGRSRAYLRKFGLCRIAFRELALLAEVPGVRKASW